MGMYLTLEISGERGTREAFSVHNIGHPDTGLHPADDDLRRYEVNGEFTVDHRRGDGRFRLAVAVFEEVERRRKAVEDG